MPTFTSTALRLGAMLLCASASGAHADACGDKFGNSSIEGNRCRGALLDAQEARLDSYLMAAESRAKAMPQRVTQPPIDLRSAQKAWVAYRTAQCGDVYLFWVDGTYRYEAAFACNQQLTRERMHDLWLAYLTYPDGTPPDLPEP